MTTTYSDKLRIALQGDGDNPTTWGEVANESVFELLEDAIAGYLNLDISGSSNITLTTANGATDQARMAMLELSGFLTGNINVTIPTLTKTYTVKTSFTGAFKPTITTGSGATVTLETGRKTTLFCDGTNVYDLGFDSSSLGDLAYLDTITSTGLLGTEIVTTSIIASLAVTTPKIANQAVTNEKLANGAVTTSCIASGAITASLLSPTLFSSSIAATGFYTLPGGFTVQWGTTSLAAEMSIVTVAFPIPFTTVYNVTTGTQRPTTTYDIHNDVQIYGAPTNSQVVFVNQQYSGSEAYNYPIVAHWQAFGKV